MKKTCLKTSCKWAVNVTVLREFFIKWALQQMQRRSSKAQLHRGARHIHDTLVSFVVIATLIKHSHWYECIAGTFPTFVLLFKYSQVATSVKLTSINVDNTSFSKYYIMMQFWIMYCLPSADGVEHNSFLYKMRLCATPK
jgi:uncharacterized membrane protein